MTLLQSSSSGSILFDDCDILHHRKEIRSVLGYLPQDFRFFEKLKTWEFLDYGAGLAGIRGKRKRAEVVDELLRKVGLYEVRDRWANRLSGGMKRRLMIARALMHEPRLLILDEPTAGVDIELRREMWDFLRNLNAQGTTIILTTHYLEEAEMLCRNIGIIQSGELIENTSMKNLLSKLQFETFIFDLEPFEHKPVISGYKNYFEDSRTLVAEVQRDQGVNGIFEQLTRQGIKVASMRNKSNRLEELFLKITDVKHQSEGKNV